MSENTKSQPVLIAASVVAAGQAFVSTLALTDVITKDALGIITGALAAVSIGLGFYVRGVVVPLKDTAAYVDKTGEVVSGPAAPPEGEPAVVVPNDEPVAADNVDALYEGEGD